jgi:uncharacterized protein YktB (UPF0637 family)
VWFNLRNIRPKADGESFRIEWRDQSIRRLEELLRITRDQLDETARRKGIRDEENNKLRAEVDRLKDAAKREFADVEMLSNEVDRLKAKNTCLVNVIDGMNFWMKEKDNRIIWLAGENERLKKATRYHP